MPNISKKLIYYRRRETFIGISYINNQEGVAGGGQWAGGGQVAVDRMIRFWSGPDLPSASLPNMIQLVGLCRISG